MTNNDLLPYLEPILQFCRRRVNNPHDAEDLASEIVCHILAGMKTYAIHSPEAWIWRIAHNRYARYVDRKKKSEELLSEEELYDLEDDYCSLDELLSMALIIRDEENYRLNFPLFTPEQFHELISRGILPAAPDDRRGILHFRQDAGGITL